MTSFQHTDPFEQAALDNDASLHDSVPTENTDIAMPTPPNKTPIDYMEDTTFPKDELIEEITPPPLPTAAPIHAPVEATTNEGDTTLDDALLDNAALHQAPSHTNIGEEDSDDFFAEGREQATVAQSSAPLMPDTTDTTRTDEDEENIPLSELPKYSAEPETIAVAKNIAHTKPILTTTSLDAFAAESEAQLLEHEIEDSDEIDELIEEFNHMMPPEVPISTTPIESPTPISTPTVASPAPVSTPTVASPPPVPTPTVASPPPVSTPTVASPPPPVSTPTVASPPPVSTPTVENAVPNERNFQDPSTDLIREINTEDEQLPDLSVRQDMNIESDILQSPEPELTPNINGMPPENVIPASEPALTPHIDALPAADARQEPLFESLAPQASVETPMTESTASNKQSTESLFSSPLAKESFLHTEQPTVKTPPTSYIEPTAAGRASI